MPSEFLSLKSTCSVDTIIQTAHQRLMRDPSILYGSCPSILDKVEWVDEEDSDDSVVLCSRRSGPPTLERNVRSHPATITFLATVLEEDFLMTADGSYAHPTIFHRCLRAVEPRCLLGPTEGPGGLRLWNETLNIMYQLQRSGADTFVWGNRGLFRERRCTARGPAALKLVHKDTSPSQRIEGDEADFDYRTGARPFCTDDYPVQSEAAKREHELLKGHYVVNPPLVYDRFGAMIDPANLRDALVGATVEVQVRISRTVQSFDRGALRANVFFPELMSMRILAAPATLGATETVNLCEGEAEDSQLAGKRKRAVSQEELQQPLKLGGKRRRVV